MFLTAMLRRQWRQCDAVLLVNKSSQKDNSSIFVCLKKNKNSRHETVSVSAGIFSIIVAFISSKMALVVNCSAV